MILIIIMLGGYTDCNSVASVANSKVVDEASTIPTKNEFPYMQIYNVL
jgi:hypothetical protein